MCKSELSVFSVLLQGYMKPISFANSTCLPLTILNICFLKKNPYPTLVSTKYKL